jgi:hypothetical protein
MGTAVSPFEVRFFSNILQRLWTDSSGNCSGFGVSSFCAEIESLLGIVAPKGDADEVGKVGDCIGVAGTVGDCMGVEASIGD